MNQFSPILLNALIGYPATNTATSVLAALGGTASNGVNRLLNPNRAPMLVDVIRLGNPNSISQGDSNISTELTQMQVQILAGAVPLTNGFVPLASVFHRVPNENSNTVFWALPKPMFLPRDVQLFLTLRHDIRAWPSTATFQNSGWSVNVVGRSLPSDAPTPKNINVPWVAATRVPGGNLDFESTDADLTNPHEQDLNVTRFIGWSDSFDLVNPVGGNAGQFYGFDGDINVRMTLSSGKILLRDPTHFYDLFPQDFPFFKCAAVVPSRSFVRARVQIGPPSAFNSEIPYPNPVIGMHGYRLIPTPWGQP